MLLHKCDLRRQNEHLCNLFHFSFMKWKKRITQSSKTYSRKRRRSFPSLLNISFQVDHFTSALTETTAVGFSCGLTMIQRVPPHRHLVIQRPLHHPITSTGITQVLILLIVVARPPSPFFCEGLRFC